MFSFITPKSLGTFKDPCGICYDNFKVGDVVRHHISSNLDHMHPIHVECPNMSGLYSNAQCPTCRSPYLSAREQKEVDLKKICDKNPSDVNFSKINKGEFGLSELLELRKNEIYKEAATLYINSRLNDYPVSFLQQLREEPDFKSDATQLIRNRISQGMLSYGELQDLRGIPDFQQEMRDSTRIG
ncbi:MAG: hypothetical protein VX185_11225 [Pseudomonadota bacterium]|nr:hypothetical protein [Pseudomonadota bacterium]|tara:strand:+ start:5495 stop:6049 length:555 start_codon:yes stop_codon:yes gene_type:complete